MPSDSRAPLSLAQRRLWFIDQLRPRRVVHNAPSAHRLLGPLNEAAFSRAFADLIDRQASLRTVIGIEAGTAIQRVLPRIDVRLFPAEDLSALPAETREGTLNERLLASSREPFVLTEGPLFRARMYRLGAEEHVLFFMPHQLIWDGWSFELFHQEMSALYAAYSQGLPSPLEALPISYGDFAAEQGQRLRDAEVARQVAYWKQRLAGTRELEPLALPTDAPRPAIASEQGGTEWLPIPREKADAVRALARENDATEPMVLVAVFAALLHKLTGQRELVVGTPVHGRDVPEVEKVMGSFGNALPLRLAIDPARSFAELLALVRTLWLEALAHQKVPIEHLVRELGAPRDEARSPLFQSLFDYQDVRQRTSSWGDLRHEHVPVREPGAAHDLSLRFVERADGLRGGLNYATDLFTVETARRINQRYAHLLDAVLAQPTRPLAELSVVPDEELEQLRRFNATDAAIPRHVSGEAPRVEALVEAQARQSAQRAAVVSPAGATVSYGALEARANRIARCLRRRGIGRGALVGVALERSPDMIATVLAVLKAGATYVPIDPAYPPARVALMVDDSKMSLAVTTSAVASALGLPADRLLSLDGDARELDVESGEPVPPLADPPTAEDAAYVIYTSGSTGTPKGVRVPHRAVVNFLASMRERPGLAPDDRLLAVTTLSFDIAVLELLLPLVVGAQIILATRDQASDGVALARLVDVSNATIMQATPGTWRLLLEAGWRGSPGFRVLCGGEPLPLDLAQALLGLGVAVWNMYGPTETTVWSTCARVEDPQRGISIGAPITNTQVWILDDRRHPCPIGVVGEIHIGGDGVALGYLDRPELTAERFVPDPFSDRPAARLYRTGDLGRWRSEGVLECLGRGDLQVKVRGHRIELGEIEAVLARHPTVAQAVVAAWPGPGGDKQLVAYLVGRPGGVAPGSDLRRHLRASLPDHMIPPVYLSLEALPLTPNGKIDRNALPDPVATSSEPEPPTDFAPPETPSERQLAALWSEMLNVAAVGRGDNFFDLGGHSLLVMRVIAEMERQTGRRLGPRAFIFDTLEQVAKAYDQAGAPPEAVSAVRVGAMKGLLSRMRK